MPMFDYVCHKCGHVVRDVLVHSGGIAPPCHCDYEMNKLPSAPSFTVNGYNAKNRYSKEGSNA